MTQRPSVIREQTAAGRRVVVVDGLCETAQVLRAVFEPQGHRVDRVRGYEPHAAEPRGVLVLHDDGGAESARRHKYGAVPRVVIGSLTVEQPAASDGDECRLAHPFQYGELIRAVAELLDAEARRAA